MTKVMEYIKKSYNSTTKNSTIQKWALDWNRHFSKADTRMANNCVKRYSASFTIVETQIELREMSPHTCEDGCDRKKDNNTHC